MSAPQQTIELAVRVAGHSFAPVTGSASGRTHLDLFSGIGGFALAASWAGWTTIGFAETDDYASKVLKRHWPNVPNFGDVRNIRNVRADLITGGFPCQPFSTVGKRGGKNDDRYLWPEMRRIISESRATWVCGENVPELDGVALGDVLADMEALGYEVQTLEIPACGVGAPHKRRRLWILAHAAQQPERKPATETHAVATGGQAWYEPGNSREHVADANRQSPERTAIARQESNPWAIEPAVGRVAHGIPNRVDRLRGLGNAIVPQVATVILEAMARMQNAEAQPRAGRQ